MTRTALVLLALALSGCVLPGFPDCTPRLAMMSWHQPGLYEALDAPRPPRMSTLVEEKLPRGMPFSHQDGLARAPYGILREIRWTMPPLAPDDDVESHPETVQGGAYLPDPDGGLLLHVATLGAKPSRDMVERFLAAVIDAPADARRDLADEMMTTAQEGGQMWSYQSRTSLPVRADALYADALALREPTIEDYGRQVLVKLTGATFVFDLPARIATFSNDSNGWTRTTEDDGLPYFRVYATPGGTTTLTRAEGNSRFGFQETDAMAWLNETFAASGLPPPSFEKWRADYATCI